MGFAAVSFDLTIRAGDLLVVAGLMTTSIAFLFGVNFRLTAVERELGELSGVLVALARQGERQTALEQRVADLQHGRGFILELPSNVRGVPRE